MAGFFAGLGTDFGSRAFAPQSSRGAGFEETSRFCASGRRHAAAAGERLGAITMAVLCWEVLCCVSFSEPICCSTL